MTWWHSLTPAVRFRSLLAGAILLFAILLGGTLSFSLTRYTVNETETITREAVQEHINYLFRDLFSKTDTSANYQLEHVAKMHFNLYHITHTDFFTPDGTVVFSYTGSRIGQRATEEERAILSTISTGNQAVSRTNGTNLSLWFPIMEENGHLEGFVHVERNIAVEAAHTRGVILLCMGAIALGALLLFLLLKRVYDRSTDQIAEQAATVRRMLAETEQANAALLQALSNALDSRDNETNGHAFRVTAYTLRLARQMGVGEEQLPDIIRGSLLHDVGKIGVPDSILLKQGPLSKEEWIVMQSHVSVGYEMLKHIPFLAPALEIVRYHHEKWDGTGYPHGIAGEKIPLAARIFSLCDTYDAITSDRPYRKGRSHQEACDEIQRMAGTQFDPAVVEAFLRIPQEEWLKIAQLARSQHRAKNHYDLLLRLTHDAGHIA
ncbi:HD-GYP domain-containing protein [Brevibacillus sp. SYP-B805]|uniref:HD-GYP domain-containing protein n=1 Tax=Brevibacillus sp. SYP-B805 TaxID=1578199 RepID=UPI0019D0B1B1|nr:HD-GYP domain-containing protein [Brevibacillus sp. SYP-B805]